MLSFEGQQFQGATSIVEKLSVMSDFFRILRLHSLILAHSVDSSLRVNQA